MNLFQPDITHIPDAIFFVQVVLSLSDCFIGVGRWSVRTFLGIYENERTSQPYYFKCFTIFSTKEIEVGENGCLQTNIILNLTENTNSKNARVRRNPCLVYFVFIFYTLIQPCRSFW